METIMNMSFEVLALFILHTLGVAVFGKFEAETAWWRLTLKWIVLFTLTYGLYSFFGHAIALSVVLLLAPVGLAFHFWWCRKNKIHPIHATPRRKYYELRGWKWPE
jgi:hypothetical protein